MQHDAVVISTKSCFHHTSPPKCPPNPPTQPDQQDPESYSALSRDEQLLLASDLRAQERGAAARLQRLLVDASLAPHFEVDRETLEYLLEPLGDDPAALGAAAAAAAAAGAASRSGAAASAAAVEDGSGSGSGSGGGGAEIVLSLTVDLVRSLLERHPDERVRREVFEGGLLDRLDRALTAWGELAETRRKLARCRGCGSYADWVLQGTGLGAPLAALAALEAVAARQRAPAQRRYAAAVKQWRAQSGGGVGRPEGEEINPWDLEAALAQVRSWVV
jgi:hypothetical protein